MPKKHERLLRRQLHDVSVQGGFYAITPPKHRGLVISGGGARGIAYAGMIQEMDRRGFINELTHVSGASAGAMTASLVAIGMSSSDVVKLVKNLNFNKLLDKEGLRIRAKGERFRNALEVIYMLQMEQHLQNAQKPLSQEGQRLQNKIDKYREILTKAELKINSIDDLLSLTESPIDLKKLDDAFASLPKNSKPHNDRITFGDLAIIKTMLHPDEQNKIKDLTVAITNQDSKSLETYNGKDSERSLADIVQLSGAHPLLFEPRKADHSTAIMADGGILDNMPTQTLLDAGLDQEEILCVYTQEQTTFQERVNSGKAHTKAEMKMMDHALNLFVGRFIGGDFATQDNETVNREKMFYHVNNMLYLDSGNIGVATMSATTVQKDKAIKNGSEQTKLLLDGQTKLFAHPLIAMLYLGEDKLNATMRDSTDPVLGSAACQAKALSFMQDQLVKAVSKNSRELFSCLESIDSIIKVNPNLSAEIQRQALILCLHQANYLTEGKLQARFEDMAKKTPLMKLNLQPTTPEMLLAQKMLDLCQIPIESLTTTCVTTQFKKEVKQLVEGRDENAPKNQDNSKKQDDTPSSDSISLP